LGKIEADSYTGAGDSGRKTIGHSRLREVSVRFTAWRARLGPILPKRGTTEEADAEPTGPRNSPAIAAGLSFVWPGLGQLFLGRKVAAAVLAVPALLVVVVLALQLAQGLLWFAASLWNGPFFVTIVVLVLGLGIWRVVAVGHAFIWAAHGRRRRPKEMAFVAAMLVLIVAMHGLFVAGAWAWYDASVNIQNNDIFGTGQSPAAGASATAFRPKPVDTTSFAPPAWIDPGGAAVSIRPVNPNRITFLLVGMDFMTGRDHSLTDTLMIVSMDMATEKVSILSVPRDTSSFPLYYGGKADADFKINTMLGSLEYSNALGSPDPPMKTLENEIGYLVGIPVNYYALIDLEGFSKMIDAVGGLDIVNEQDIDDPSTGIVMAAGPVHLDGPTAMLYVRSRENGGSDYLRSARQQGVLMALEHKIASPSGITRLPTLLKLAATYIGTDFPLGTANKYVSSVQNIKHIVGCVLGPPYSIHPDTSVTGGKWTTYLDLRLVGGVSLDMFGQDSTYYGQPGVTAAPCQ
jgi:LCP family protein required for cell wall assembly